MSSIRHDMTEIICSVLDDGKWHSIEEMRIEVEKKNVKFLSNKNYLSVILTGLKNDEKKIISDSRRKGWYRMKNVTSVEDESVEQEKTCRTELLNEWKNFCESTGRKKTPSYEMTEEEFKKGRWFYRLNKKIENLIMNFEEE